MIDAVVVGAGIAGLTAAHELKQKGRSFLMLEKGTRWGGCLHSVRTDGVLLEKGPNSFLSSHETLMKYVDVLGLKQELIQANDSAKQRFVLSGDRLIPIPTTPANFLRTPLLTFKGKLRFLLEPLITKKCVASESVAQFVTRRLGKEALNLVAPMIHGIYAGEAEQLEFQAIAPKLAKAQNEYGSLFQALRKVRLFSQGSRLFSFREGMQTLANGFYERLKENCRLGCESIELTRLGNQWKVRWNNNGEWNETAARSVVISTPAYEAADLLQKFNPALARQLRTIFYAPLALMHLVIERSQFAHFPGGFGFLAGAGRAGEKSFLLGSLFSSTIFEHRCNSSKILLTCFAGGAGYPEILNHSQDQIVFQTLEKLRTIFRTPFQAEVVSVTRLPKALPQYTLGHCQRIQEIRNQLRDLPGLYLTGNYLNGVSVNDTMQNATQTTQQMI